MEDGVFKPVGVTMMMVVLVKMDIDLLVRRDHNIPLFNNWNLNQNLLHPINKHHTLLYPRYRNILMMYSIQQLNIKMQINIRMLEMKLFNRIEYQTRYQAQLIFHFTQIHCRVLVDIGDSGTFEIDEEVFNYVLEG